MDDRLTKLLQVAVDEYILTAEPVGSQYLVERYHLTVSPATVRHWFVALEEAGYLTQPHTSGGRIPTEEGFRLYTELFVKSRPASKRERELLDRASRVPCEDGRQLKGVAKALAEVSNQSTFVGLLQADTYYTGLTQLFSQPEFKNWKQVVSLTEVLDHLDETLDILRRQRYPEPKIMLGKNCPFGVICGSVVLSINDEIIGILGPLRMNYQHAFSLLLTAKQLLITT